MQNDEAKAIQYKKKATKLQENRDCIPVGEVSSFALFSDLLYSIVGDNIKYFCGAL